MHMTISKNCLFNFIGRSAAVTVLSAAATLGLHAQQSAGTTPSLPPISLEASLAAPLDLSLPDDLKYSSSIENAETANLETFNLGSDAGQPPPRRRYSRPNYSDSHTNSDGSAKYTFFVGGGFTLPVGGTHNYLAPSYDVQAGAGRNFNKKYGVNVQFDWDNFGFQTATLNNQLAIYNGLCTPAEEAAGDCTPFTQLGGNSHVWSFTVDPIMNFYSSDTFGAYVTGGGGFYHKTANFTTPAIGEYCSPFYGCIEYQANQTIDKYTSNAFGVNGGVGMTYKFSRFAGEKFYVEGRYVYTFNSARAFSYGDANGNGFNVFPQNSAKTSFIPITFGVRF
jgi:type II secretory pathway pseudopilin PulG